MATYTAQEIIELTEEIFVTANLDINLEEAVGLHSGFVQGAYFRAKAIIYGSNRNETIEISDSDMSKFRSLVGYKGK